MASKKGPPRGVSLVKKALESARTNGKLTSPEPVPAPILKKLRLPNDEKLSPALKELLANDRSWLGLPEFDDEEPEFDAVSLSDVIEQELGEDMVSRFGEAHDLFGDDCIPLPTQGEVLNVLYIGTPDAAGEYPVISLIGENAWVGGFVPFDVWLAQQLGALPFEVPGWIPEPYEASVKELAEANGDGRTSFQCDPNHARSEVDDDDEDEDEDE